MDSSNNYCVGDQIQIGKYTATCQKVTDNTVIFMFDDLLDKTYQMNHTATNEGGYESSDLRTILNEDCKNDPEFNDIYPNLIAFDNGDCIRIATVGEIFGNNDFFVMDDAEQWELMKIPPVEEETIGWAWLQNNVLKSRASFAIFSLNRNPGGNTATAYFGVRPVIQLAK